MNEQPTDDGSLALIDRLHVLDWINLKLCGPLWQQKAIAQRIATEQHIIIDAAHKATNSDPDAMIAELAHKLARARLAIHYEETRKAWLEAGG